MAKLCGDGVLFEAATFSLSRSLLLSGGESVGELFIDAAFNSMMVCCSVNVLTFLAGFLTFFLGTLPEEDWSGFVAD